MQSIRAPIALTGNLQVYSILACNLKNVFMMGDTFKQQHSTTRSPRSFRFSSPNLPAMRFVPSSIIIRIDRFSSSVHARATQFCLRETCSQSYTLWLFNSMCPILVYLILLTLSDVHQSFTSLFLHYIVYPGSCPHITSLLQLLKVLSLIMSLIFVW